MLKQSITGRLIGITETHYITKVGDSTQCWHKDYYRMENHPLSSGIVINGEKENIVPAKNVYMETDQKVPFMERVSLFWRNIFSGSIG